MRAEAEEAEVEGTGAEVEATRRENGTKSLSYRFLDISIEADGRKVDRISARVREVY